MAHPRTNPKRRVLPDSPRELIKWCKSAGWTSRRSNGGTLVTSPTGLSVLIPDRLGGRSRSNIHAALRRAGLETDLDAADEHNEERRQAGLDAPPRANVPALTVVQAEPEVATVVPITRESGGEVSAMHTETVLITPELAREWLDRELPFLPDGRRVKQRPRRDSHILWLAEQMATEGKWRTTGQGISLAPEAPHNTGGVLDGQHRLLAIELNGVPQRMRVTYNEDPRNFDVLDTGKGRTAGDVLTIIGETNTYHLASVAKLLGIWEMWREDPTGPLRDWMSWNRIKLTNADVLDIVGRWPDLGDHLRSAATFVGPPVRINIAAVTVFRLWAAERWPACAEPRGEQPSLLDAWFDQLREGYNLDKGMPLLLLRNWLTGGGPKRTPGASREATLVALIKCWNNDQLGKSMDLLRVASNDQMPVPYRPAD